MNLYSVAVYHDPQSLHAWIVNVLQKISTLYGVVIKPRDISVNVALYIQLESLCVYICVCFQEDAFQVSKHRHIYYSIKAA